MKLFIFCLISLKNFILLHIENSFCCWMYHWWHCYKNRTKNHVAKIIFKYYTDNSIQSFMEEKKSPRKYETWTHISLLYIANMYASILCVEYIDNPIMIEYTKPHRYYYRTVACISSSTYEFTKRTPTDDIDTEIECMLGLLFSIFE